MIKKKRKQQQQLVTQSVPSTSLVGSDEYLFNRKFDSLDRELRKNIREHEGTKKLLILNAADKYDKLGYPRRLICKRISDLLSKPEYHTSESYVRKILPEKYKNLDQMNIAKKQNVQDGANRYRQQERVAKKKAKDITLEDFRYIKMNKAKAAFKHQRDKANYFEHLAKDIQMHLAPKVDKLFNLFSKDINQN